MGLSVSIVGGEEDTVGFSVLLRRLSSTGYLCFITLHKCCVFVGLFYN